MKNIDEEIEKILREEEKCTLSEHEIVNFVNEGDTILKECEQISFFGDQQKKDYTHEQGPDFLKRNDIMSLKPFLAAQDVPSPQKKRNSIELSDLQELLGIGEDEYNRKEDFPKTTDILQNTHEQNQYVKKIKEVPDFVDNLFSKQPSYVQKPTQYFGGIEYSEDMRNPMRLNSANYEMYTTGIDNGAINDEFAASEWKSGHTNNFMMQRSSSPEDLLFRNPSVRQSTFNIQGYSKIKKRRRLNSNRWTTSAAMLAFHPSKLSSVEFVHGGMQFRQNAEIQADKMVLSPRPSNDSNTIKERFRKHAAKIDFENVTVYELKNIMKDYGLNPSGKKQEMIDRIKKTLRDLGDNTDEHRRMNTKEGPLYEKYFF